MKHFLIRYQFKEGSAEAWHRQIAQFISALDNDPDLKGRVAYRCMKIRDGADYFHMAAATDEKAIAALQSKDWFKRYTEETKLVAGGAVEVSPLEIIAETAFRA